jgi:molecular chaperone HscB
VAVTYAYDAASERVVRLGLDKVAMGVGVATTAWAAMALEAAHAADAAHDAAVQLGLSAEEYTRWAYVVERAGGQVEHLRVGMTTLQRQLGAARDGNDQAAKAFARLGLGAEVASGQLGTAADALPQVLDALAAIDDDGRRAALSLQVLGEAGPRLAGLLELGTEGIEQLRQRADALGVTISDDVVEDSGDLVDALEDIGLYARGVARDVGFSLVPALAKVATATRAWLVANDGIVDQQLDRTVGALGEAIDLNAAYRALRDDLTRARALLDARGDRTAGDGRETDPAFLAELMDLREALGEARAARELARVEGLAAQVERSYDNARRALAAALDAREHSKAEHHLGRMRYYRRFLDEVDVIREESELG